MNRRDRSRLYQVFDYIIPISFSSIQYQGKNCLDIEYWNVLIVMFAGILTYQRIYPHWLLLYPVSSSGHVCFFSLADS